MSENPHIVLAWDIPFTSRETDPLKAIRTLIALDSRDWAHDRADAWLYGIVRGWDTDEPGEESAMPSVAARHGWDGEQVARLRALHAEFRRLPAGD